MISVFWFDWVEASEASPKLRRQGMGWVNCQGVATPGTNIQHNLEGKNHFSMKSNRTNY